MTDLAPLLTPERHELAELVSELHSLAAPWIPSGLGNHLHWGPKPQIECAVVSLQRLNQVLEHAVGDFIVTVEAGMPLNELQTFLAKEGQWLPINPPVTGQSSIGGIVSRGMGGTLLNKYMGIRDQIIGIEVVRTDGTVAKSGGRVVKNVAGYDLMRLFCGSWGKVGLIKSITLRTQPLQKYRSSIAITEHLKDLLIVNQTLKAANNNSIEELWWHSNSANENLLNATLSSQNRDTLYEQEQKLTTLAKNHGAEADKAKHCKYNFYTNQANYPRKWLVRIGVLPDQSQKLVNLIDHDKWNVCVDALSGLGVAWSDSERIEDFEIRNLKATCTNLGGYLFSLEVPKQTNHIGWNNSKHENLSLAVQRAFDPLQQLNHSNRQQSS